MSSSIIHAELYKRITKTPTSVSDTSLINKTWIQKVIQRRFLIKWKTMYLQPWNPLNVKINSLHLHAEWRSLLWWIKRSQTEFVLLISIWKWIKNCTIKNTCWNGDMCAGMCFRILYSNGSQSKGREDGFYKLH